jgi:hypothetical protein
MPRLATDVMRPYHASGPTVPGEVPDGVGAARGGDSVQAGLAPRSGRRLIALTSARHVAATVIRSQGELRQAPEPANVRWVGFLGFSLLRKSFG